MPVERLAEILVVEDNASEREPLCEILRKEGFRVVGCGSEAEAFQQIRQRAFGVAIVDLGIPGLNGNQFLDRVRNMDNQVQVLLYSDAAWFDSAEKMIPLGAFASLEKQNNPSELLRHVHWACRERAKRYAIDMKDAVRRQTEQLTRSTRELEDFASITAHDLRSPLLTISGYCQMLREECGDQLSTAGQQYIEQIVQGAARMNRLIEDLLHYSRISRSEERLQPVNLEEVLAEVVANLDAAIRQSGARIDIQSMPTVSGVRTQLVHIFQNLIQNAIKFRREAPPVVLVRATAEGDNWQFSVEDNGIGIEPEQFERIFQIFTQIRRKEYPGTGIGLAVCKRIVELHGGRIWITSQIEKGTTVFFTIPGRHLHLPQHVV